MSLLWELDPVALVNVRKKGNLVAVYDLLNYVTGQGDACRKMWLRLIETHPELVAICHDAKFNSRGRGSNFATPATDAEGVIQILMALPGPAARLFRMKAANVLVRYLGGDPELVTEIWANRDAQEALANDFPCHPARIFGEAVEAGRLAVHPVEDLEEQLLRAQIAKEISETTSLQAQGKLARFQAA